MIRLTLMLVKRDRNEAVTDRFKVPILIPAAPEQQEGVATFEPGPPGPVRTFTDSDLGNAAKHLTAGEAKHFSAVVALTRALENPADIIALRKATAAFDEAYRLRRAEATDSAVDQEIADALGRLIGVPAQEAVGKFWPRTRPGPRAAADPRWLLSYAVSEPLANSSRLVLWWNGVRFTPAVRCDDIRTAFYVRAALDVVGGRGFRICPHCSEPFFLERSNQNYCSIAHREAHRVARWRAAQLDKKKRKRGGKNVSRKAR